MKTSYYRPSGKVTGMFFLYFLLFILVSIPVLSMVYIYLIHFIPIVYLNIFITIGCGAGLGFVVGYAAKRGKARNPVLLYLLTFLAAVMMKYVQWAVYIPMILSDVYGIWYLSFADRFIEPFRLLIDPVFMFDAAWLINEVGVWGIVDTAGRNAVDAVNGVMLLIIWIGEFILMGGAALLVAGAVTKLPFSEEADDWYTEVGLSNRFDKPEHFDALQREMENGSFSQFLEHVRAGSTNPSNFLGLSMHQPPESALTEPYFLTVTEYTVTQQGRGGKRKKKAAQTQTKTKPLIRHLAVDRRTAREIIDMPEYIEMSEPTEPTEPTETAEMAETTETTE